MGILDDAIREHLDLKRRQGADQEELARLEDEAFGPPTRPGDPEFADASQEGERTAATNGESAEATATEVPAFHDQRAAPPEAEPSLSLADEETGEQALAPEASGPATEEPTALAGEPTVEHDTLGAEGEPESMELDIDLDIEEEIEDVGELDLEEGEGVQEAGAEEAEPAAGSASDEPVESLDTVEHHFDEALDEAEVVDAEVVEDEVVDAEVVEDEDAGNEDAGNEDAGNEDAGAEGAGEDSDEDVLEETPEFLRDAPEDDELWFEQGEPKDFDF